MDRLDLIIIAKNHNINEDIFSKFIMKRFPKEEDKGYVNEWAERFSTGNPEIYMDSQSKAIYEKVK